MAQIVRLGQKCALGNSMNVWQQANNNSNLAVMFYFIRKHAGKANHKLHYLVAPLWAVSSFKDILMHATLLSSN